jgi:hypothetical protein
MDRGTMSGDPVAFLLFCDDIRREDSGKLIMVGVYQSEMVFPELPATLPQLNVLINLREPKDKMSKTVDIVVSIPVDQEFRKTMACDVSPVQEKYLMIHDDVTHSSVSSTLRLENVRINSEGSIVVYIETPTRRIRAGSLKVVRETRATIQMTL